jgi:hypothetical protein
VEGAGGCEPLPVPHPVPPEGQRKDLAARIRSHQDEARRQQLGRCAWLARTCAEMATVRSKLPDAKPQNLT